MQQISPNVYLASVSAGCNVGVLVTSQGIVVLDAPFNPREAVALRDELNQMGEVLYVVNTEPHIDHVTGNTFLPGNVVATESTRDVLSQPGEQEKAIARVLELWPDSAATLEGFRFRLPTITFADRLTLRLGDHSVHLLALPGHSAGNLVVHIAEEGVVFAGDNIVNRYGPALHQAMPRAWMRSLDVIESLQPRTIVPGHGRPCASSYIPRFREELHGIQKMVEQAIQQGLSKEETTARLDFLSAYLPDGIQINESRRANQRDSIRRVYELLSGESSESE